MSQHLTGLAVTRHKFPEPPLLDGKCPGLRLVALRPLRDGAERKSWIYRYRSKDGRLRQIKLGMYPHMSLATARAAWSGQKAIRDDPGRGDPQAELRQTKARKLAEAISERESKYTVKQLCEDYLREYIDKRRKMTAEPRRLLEREVIPVLGTLSSKMVVRTQVHELIQKIVGRGAPRVAQMTRVELRRAFEHAVNAGRLQEPFVNPCDRVPVPPQRRRTRAFSEAELKSFLIWLPKSKMSRSVRDAMRLELLTTARQGEIVSMRKRDVDLATRVWRQPNSKNGRPHEVLLSTQAAQLLSFRSELNNEWFFPRPDGGGPIASKAIGIQQYAAKADLPFTDWTPHDLRRSALTGLARLGCPRVVQDRISNHVDGSIAAIYDQHSYDAEAREWLQRWADHLDAMIVDEPAMIASMMR
jgi:integrase